MKLSLRKGFSFGLTSAAITTLGMIIGLDSAMHSKLVVIGGILSIAVADSFSDALGIHISEESHEKNHEHVSQLVQLPLRLPRLFNGTGVEKRRHSLCIFHSCRPHQKAVR